MGCKESKHIATENTIISPTSSTKSTNRGQDDNDKTNFQTLQRSRSQRSPMQKQESFKGDNVGDSKANNVSNENEKSGGDKVTVDVKKELEKEGGELKEMNDQDVKGDKPLVKEIDYVGNEANINKEDQNGNVGDNGGKESILIPKDQDLPSTSKNDDQSIEAINTDGVSEASVYSTPTQVSGVFENKDTNTDPENHVREAEVEEQIKEAEVEEKIKEAEAAVATTAIHQREAEVEEKIKKAEAAVETLEKLVKEAENAKEIPVTEAEAAAANIQNPVKETEEIPVKEVEAINAALQKPENRGTETRVTDATLQNAVTESGKTNETLIKEGEAVENGVKEIHEVTGKAEEIPVKEVETFHESDQENQAQAAEVLKEAETNYTTPKELVKEADNAEKVIKDLMTVAEAVSTAIENPVNE